MDPTVAAAAIGVGGTVVVGVAGFGAAIWNTRRTISHDRESRLWDRRAEVYVEALAAIHYRQVSREIEINPVDDQTRRRGQAILATYKPPDWPGLEARLQAFASEPVITATQASSTAHRDAINAFRSWRAYENEVSLEMTPPPVFKAAVMAADEAAEAADDAVVELIRTELQGKGRPLGDWQAFEPAPGPPN